MIFIFSAKFVELLLESANFGFLSIDQALALGSVVFESLYAEPLRLSHTILLLSSTLVLRC